MEEEDDDATPRPLHRELPSSPAVVAQSNMDTASAPNTDELGVGLQDNRYIAMRSPTPSDEMLIQGNSDAATPEQDAVNGAIVLLMEYLHRELINEHIHVSMSPILDYMSLKPHRNISLSWLWTWKSAG
jgi:hypothetical protein